MWEDPPEDVALSSSARREMSINDLNFDCVVKVLRISVFSFGPSWGIYLGLDKQEAWGTRGPKCSDL